MSILRSAVAKSLLIVAALLLPAVAGAQTGNVIISTNTTWATGTYNVTSLAVLGGAVLTIGGGSSVTATGAVTVTANSSIVLQSTNNTAQVSGSWQGAGVTLQAGSVQVDAGSSINADGQGYISNAGPGGGIYGSGGTYGGLGGSASSTVATYGSAAQPVDLGSGGGQAQYTGSNGGGAIRLIVSGTLTLNGTISANGEMVEPARGGAGAGGSVYVTTATLTGSGVFTANGGSNMTPQLSGSPSGGGGRVAIYYANAQSFTGFANTTAAGGIYTGTTTGYTGAVGTAAFFDTSAANLKLNLFQNFPIAATSTSTYSQMAVQNGAVLTIGGGSNIMVTGAITVTGRSTIVLQSINNTALVNGGWQGTGVTLNAASVQVDAGSSVSADAQGYISNAGPGAGIYGSGGTYGGEGGYNNNAVPLYGSALLPTDLGSGGGGAQYVGSNGGGAIRLNVSGTLTNNGTISANGEIVEPARGGGGAGGSVYVTTGTLAGAGTFTANGGSNTTPTLSGSAAGGGGCVAIYSASASGFTGFTGSTATGGVYTGTAGYTGANGSVAFFDTSEPNANVSVYQGFDLPANSVTQFNSFSLAQGASFVLGGGSQVSVAQALHISGTITALAINNAGLVQQKYRGQGVTIAAGSVLVDAGGAINADSQGYAANIGPGGGGYTIGGSYGGLGGQQQDATKIYGSLTGPTDLGSGGGSGQNTGGGSGGGAIRLLVAGTLVNNGSISANGGSLSNSGYGGGGSGGSIFIQANTVQGAGTITATGGSNMGAGNAGGGGSGGRIAIDYVNNGGLNTALVTANGGSGYTLGAVGTVKFIPGPTLAFLKPVVSVVHGVASVQFFTDIGNSTTVTEAGAQSSTLAVVPAGIGSVTWDTTRVPDGAYELRLATVDNTGMIFQLSKNIAVNNSVLWYSGTLTANTHFTAGNVYAIDADLIIPAGITLTVDPGVVVKALAGTQIIVQSGGTLIATGNPGNQVVFTTFDDASVGGNTNYNQGITLPVPGEWGGISIVSGGTFTQNSDTVVHYAGQQVPLAVTSNTTLVSTEVYEISGLLTVSSGATLTIQPGTVIKFDAGAGISMQAGSTLIANGTLAQPIYFTSINDNSVGGNTNGNTGATPPAPGDWDFIAINGATASFKYVQMQYGGGPANASVQAAMLSTGGASTVTISDSILAYSYYIGINTGYQGGGDTVTISNTTFYGIQDRAINALSGSTVHVVNSTFDGNASGVYGHGGTVDIANSVVSNSVGTQFGGIGGGSVTVVNSDVYSTAPGNVNYSGLFDPTGTNGNISANPVYMNAALHDYHPNYGSPLIDGASATVANYPPTDTYGVSRHNSPLVTAKKGTPDANGNYPDIGALEFSQTAPSDLDLTVTAVQGPPAAVVGSQVALTWTITNVGAGTVYGPWHDAIYVVTDPDTNPVETLAGVVLEGAGVVLGPGATYTATATVTVPGTVAGPHVWEVRTNIRGEVFEGANTANNKAISLDPVSVTLNRLVAGAGPLMGSFASAGQYAYYSFTATPSQATNIQLALTAGLGESVQLFVGGGYIPNPQRYDYQQTEFNSPTASVVIPSGTAQTYYIAAYGQNLPALPGAFTIQATNVQFTLSSISPNTAVAHGTSTLTFTGGGFTSSTNFALIGANGVASTPTSVFVTDSDHAEVTFNLMGLASGTYAARASNGTSITLANALLVSGDPFGGGSDATQLNHFTAVLQTPEGFRAGFPGIVTLNYNNGSGYDIPAPLIYVSAANATLTELAPTCNGCSPDFAQQRGAAFSSGVVLAINQQGPAGVLPAGGSGSISFLATPGASGSVNFFVATAGTDPVATTFQNICVQGCVEYTPVKSGAYRTGLDFCNSLVPQGATTEGYDRACMALVNAAGITYQQFNSLFSGGFVLGSPYYSTLTFQNLNKLLAADATALSKSGVYEYDAQNLFAFELQKDGLNTFLTRYHQGAFGFGSSHPYDVTLAIAGGNPIVNYPEGGTRVFYAAPAGSGLFVASVGDYGTLALQTDGSYLLTEPDGTSSHFVPNAAATNDVMDYFADHDGNKTTLAYTNGLVTSLADAFGDSLSYQYDSLGHIVQSTDAAGRLTTYTYTTLNDTQHSTFLTSKHDADGTTSITWNQGGPHGVGYFDDSCVATYCEPAIGIASIAYPDGTHTYYTYDALGRVATTSRDGGAESVTYAYNSDGSVQKTDALGKSTLTAFNQAGLPAATADALGAVTRYKYDPEYKLTGAVGPLGDSSAFEYDQMSNLASVTSPDGNLTSMAYSGYARPASLTDPSGNVTSFNYDPLYNLTATTFPNTGQVKYTWDSQGRMATRTNLRGNTVTYTYGTHNLLAAKTLSNGSQVLYTYDAHFNIQSVTTSAGVTRYTYDSADRVTTLTNPDGTSLTYTYNANGQRNSMKDSTNFVTNYAYDQAGRLSGLTNGSGGAIVSYTYDANGRLATKVLGNGTSTSFSYDPNGRTASIIHYSPSHAVLSEYDYTYDSEGNPVSLTAPSGKLTYTYDLDGQLTSATTGTAAVLYGYDPAGNRTQVTTNGVQTTYLTNNLNQYTAAGSSAYQYDADGNLISGDGWTYTYDDENHLVSMNKGADSWTFQYDGLNNRVGSVHNGAVTHYLIDPSGYGNIDAEFDGTGAVTAHYTYGLDLTTSVQAAGTTSYYHFDGSGNTSQITNSSGTVVNNYSYLPYGEKSAVTVGVANPFTYSGQWGVRDDGTGLYFMRNRWYNPALGRFHSSDPIGLQSGINRYLYAGNSPIRFDDPLGLLLVNDGNESRSMTSVGGNPCPTSSGPDYYIFSAAFGGGWSYAINRHTGKTYWSANASLGGGANASAGFLLGHAGESEEQLAAATDSFLGGWAGGPSAYVGVGGGIVYSKGSGFSLEIGFGVGGKGASGGYSEATDDSPTATSPTPGAGGTDPCGRPLPPPPPPPPVCGTCLFTPVQPQRVPINGAVDPNAKITSGYGNLGYIPSGSSVAYTIYFENLPTATAPAQKVVVIDALSSSLDWSTVQLSQVGFNNTTLNVPEATQSYTAQAKVSTDANPVTVTSSLNPTTGLLTWTIQSVDLITGGVPANPLSGFLPPNNAANAGTGFVTFTVMPKKNLANAATISNQASVVFDANAAIQTNTVTNTIDSSTPTSAVSPLPATTTATTFNVSWTGSDPTGSGVASYNIYVSVDGGTPTLWLSGTTLTTSAYTGTAGHTYGFFSLATNNVGAAQTTAAATQTITVNYLVPTVTVNPSASSITPTQPLTVNVSLTTSTFTPTGTVTLMSGSYTSAAATLTAGNASFSIPAGSLANGTDTLTVTYTPDLPGTVFFATATGSASVTVAAVNNNVQVTVSASGATFSVDGTAYTTAQTLTWVVGSTHTLATTTPQTANGSQQTFASWSDGGAASHTVTASAAVTSYTATFNTAYLLTLAASPTAGGTVSPASGTYFPAATNVNLTATPAAGYSFANWTGAVANSASATTTIILNAPQTVTANFTLNAVQTLTLTPSTLTFTTSAGAASAAQSVQLKNTGNAAITISNVAISGANATNFAQTNTCGTSVAAGATCILSVTFTAASAGSFGATLTLTDTATGSPQTVTLSGTATAAPAFSLSATPSSQTVLPGVAASYTISANPQGGAFTNAVSLSVSGLPSGATAAFTPSTLTPGTAGASSVLSITTPAGFARMRTTPWSANAPVYAALGFFLLGALRRRKRWAGSLLALLLIAVASSVSGCSHAPGATTSTITITGTSGSVIQTTTVSLTIQ